MVGASHFLKKSAGTSQGRAPRPWVKSLQFVPVRVAVRLDRVPEVINVYGNDVTLLISGALHHGDLFSNACAPVETVYPAFL